MSFKLKSPEFKNGQPIPRKYSADGEEISPPLSWSGAPPETRELALICEDPDAPMPKPFVHWIAYGISPNTSQLPAGLPNEQELELPVRIRQGLSSEIRPGYVGPNPPLWHGPHRYFFRLYALDTSLGLKPGTGRAEFQDAIQDHVLSEATLMGTYEKPRERKAAAALRALRFVGIAAAALYLILRPKRIGEDEQRASA